MSAKSAHDPAQLHTPADWAHAIEMLFSTDVRRAVVLGPADIGKSSFCRSLLFEAARRGRSVALIDADVGQKTVGPPAAVTLSDAVSYAEGELPLAGLAFAGTTSPAYAIYRRSWREHEGSSWKPAFSFSARLPILRKSAAMYHSFSPAARALADFPGVGFATHF